ncbi:MAG: 2-succinyl-6-hydroxy-2,4-cyclohexadiene-1-carboxylate synthase [Chloroflexi bacterium]|nr:2-succinyl-6-hydroxy-2,4-cyclohexadiene-1-carboxylate synthase [Chloroflexota bacterium]MCY4248077.1 2-succinyl-6-hydroxy-2,4-cyclohexadiene-1-carboxylate synthase [Chloroflexota bacterium]
MRLRAASGNSYAISCQGRGQPLLLLHGFTGDHSVWQGIAPALGASHQLIMPDLPGHGRSDSPASAEAWRMFSVAADLISLLDALEIPQSHLLGYSMGGRLALYLALRYPRRCISLTLESAAPGIADDKARMARQQSDNQLADQIEARGIAWFVDYWQALPMWESQTQLTPRARLAQQKQRLRCHPAGLAGSLRGMGTGAQPSLWEALPDLQLPTLLAVGALDSKFRRINATMAQAIPGARLEIIRGAGHNMHLEKPRQFAGLLAAHLSASSP